jgi:subtilisin family serine protease
MEPRREDIPEGKPEPRGELKRVVVVLREDAGIDIGWLFHEEIRASTLEEHFARYPELRDLLPWDAIERALGDFTFGRLFSSAESPDALHQFEAPEQSLVDMYQGDASFTGGEDMRTLADDTGLLSIDDIADEPVASDESSLAAFFRFDAHPTTERAALRAVVDLLQSRDDVVADAYVQSRVAFPGPGTTMPQAVAYLARLNLADALARGGTGQGARLVDLEQGWWFEHPQLPQDTTSKVTCISGDPSQDPDAIAHGTGILGIVLSQGIDGGPAGIAPAATGVTVSFRRETSQGVEFNIADAIYSVIDQTREPRLNVGDILLIEAQVLKTREDFDFPPNFDVPPEGVNLPVEVEPDVFRAIRAAAKYKGIVVIVAAGNGGCDLDTVRSRTGSHSRVLAITSESRDSYATMVGAGELGQVGYYLPWASQTSPAASNFGSRIDCIAHGADTFGLTIDTCGPNALQGIWQGGTSGAAAIIAGIAVVLQSIAIQPRFAGNFISPWHMRRILRRATARLAEQLSSPLTAAERREGNGVMPDFTTIVSDPEYADRFN